MVLATDRLVLRPWTAADFEAFAALNADPRVMEYFSSSVLTLERSAFFFHAILAHFDREGFGFWAVERRSEPGCIGFTGLARVAFEAPFTPAVEIGWRIAAAHWGNGYAPEAAGAALRFAFAELRLPEVVAFSAVENGRSRRVMEKIGMERDAEGDFDHPRAPPGHRLRRHVLYRIRAPLTAAQASASTRDPGAPL
jgi:RimJ/RimL family protein N-acetyltransferase